MTKPRVLFVNGGILGLGSFHRFLAETLPRQSRIRGEQILLTDRLSPMERIVRGALCQRGWRDGWLGVRNLDLARFRHEMHAGIHARRRIARHHGVDVLHFHRQATAYASLGLLKRTPSIVSIDCTQACILQQASSALERATYQPNVRRDGAVFREAALIIATSRWAEVSVKTMYPDVTTPVDVMPDPVLLDRFDAGWMDARRERAWAGARPRVLFMGGDFPRKGGPLLLDAWEAAGFAAMATLDLVTDWRVPGPLPEGVRLRRGVKAHSPDWSACWADADLFVMPTRNEAFGLVFQEAAAAGLPAIGTNHNAIPEIIQHERTGLLVPAGDRDALVHAMRRLIESASIRDRFGRAARALIESTASPGAYMDRLSGHILELAGRREGRARGPLQVHPGPSLR